MKTKLFFIRHGKSEAAERGIVQGVGLDVPLVPEGIKQSEVAAQNLRNFAFDRIFSSTALRNTHTADIIRQFHPQTPYKKLDVLNERSKGVSEGMMKDEFNKRYPEILEQWRFEIDARPEGGENFEDVEKRVVPIIEFHVKEHAGENILYIFHGNVIRVVLGYMLNVPFGLRARIKQDYCAFNAVSFDHEKSRWNIEFINQVFHK